MISQTRTPNGLPKPVSERLVPLFFATLSIVILTPFLVSAQDAKQKTEYTSKTDIPYREGDQGFQPKDLPLTDYMKERCKLDVYYPANKKDFATIVWFHGGGLKNNSKSIPKELKERGIAVVAPNYRQNPKVKSPAYIEDAASSVAWTMKNIKSLGGDPKKIFVSGHSAGGYLTSMVGMDKRWLAPHKMDPDNLAGLIPFSGHTITHFTIRSERGIDGKQPIIDDMAPLFHVRADSPPLLLITGDREKEMLGRYEENAYFWRMMQVVGHPDTEIYELEGFNHGGMAKPAFPLLISFVNKHSKQISKQETKEKKLEGKLNLHLGEPKFDLKPAFEGQRFPNVVITNRGTVLLTYGQSKILARRSEDGGATWGDPIIIANSGIHGGGTTVDESTGDIMAFAEDRHPPAPIKMYRSKDDGKTWLVERFSASRDSKGNLPAMHMNEHGITLRHGKHAGRLIRASRYYGEKNDRSEWPNHYTNAIFSDDGGKSWTTSDPFPENGTGEATIAELSDGTLYYNSRVHWQERPKNTRRRSAISKDGGMTWKDWQVVDILPDGHQHRSYGCMGGLVRLPLDGKDILIFSNIDTPNAKREKGTVWASFDGGKTWPIKRLVFNGSFAYSSLNAGRPGTPSEGWIYLHFEGGPNPKGGSAIARFNLAWLLKGEKTGDGEAPTLE